MKKSYSDEVIIFSEFATKSYWERIHILADAVYEISAPVEAVAMTPEEWESGDSLVVELARNGEVLCPAQPTPLSVPIRVKIERLHSPRDNQDPGVNEETCKRASLCV